MGICGIEGQGRFLGFHTFTRYVYIHEGDELDEAQMVNWVKQAAALPGFLGPRP